MPAAGEITTVENHPAVRDVVATLPAVFRDFHIHRDLDISMARKARRMCTRWVLGDTESVDANRVAAFRREVITEFCVEWLWKARGHLTTRAYGTYDGRQEPPEALVGLLDSGLRKLGPDSLAVVSLPCAVMLAAASPAFPQGPGREDDTDLSYSVIRYGIHRVIVDRFAFNSAPAVILGPGWCRANYVQGLGLDRVVVDPQTFEPTISFLTDLHCEVNPNAVLGFGVTAPSM